MMRKRISQKISLKIPLLKVPRFILKYRKRERNELIPRNRKKSARSGWGGPRPNSGGARPGAGRRCKIYKPIKIDYFPYESKEALLRTLNDLYVWILEDRIETRRAATATHIIDLMAKIKIPTIIEEKIEELEQKAQQISKEVRQVIADNERNARDTQDEKIGLKRAYQCMNYESLSEAISFR